MKEFHHHLVLLEQSLSPEMRTILTLLFVILALYFATEFGVSIGKAYYHLTH